MIVISPPTADFLPRRMSFATNRVGGLNAATLRLRLLGPMAVQDSAGKGLLPRSRKTRAVLAVLALASPRPILRLELIALLWSQRERQQGRASLRQSIHELLDILTPAFPRLLIVDRHQLTLRTDGLWVDATASSTPEKPGAMLLECASRTLLEDLSGLDPAFDRWLERERQRVVALATTMGEAILLEQQDDPARLDTAEKLLVLDRAHEGAWRAIIRTNADRGDRAAALAAYERCRAALAEFRGASPSVETEDLMVRVHAIEPAADIAPVTPSRNPAAGTPGEAAVKTASRSSRAGIRLGVVPLRVLGATPDDELSVGLAEEITTALSRFRGISCVPATSLAALAGDFRPDAIFRAGLDVDFVLDGTIQRGAARVRVMARLIDMRSAGEVVWARRFDRDATDTLSLQDDIGAAIVAQVDPELLMHEGERAASRSLVDPTAPELVRQAVPAIYRLERGGFHAAGRLLETALAAEPGNCLAHAWYSYWHLFLVGQGWAENPAEATRRAVELAERAVTLDPGDARALTVAGHVRGFLAKRPDEALGLHDRARALNPNLALTWCFAGLARSYLGQHEQALQSMEHAVRLSPSDPHLFFFDTAMIMPHLLCGRFEAAADVGRRALELNPWFSSACKGYLSSLGHLGRKRQAADVLARLLALEPGFSVTEAISRSPMGQPEDVDCYAEGLRRAGLPETSAISIPERIRQLPIQSPQYAAH
jgi:DNA-binding SARP family transcriptional activator